MRENFFLVFTDLIFCKTIMVTEKGHHFRSPHSGFWKLMHLICWRRSWAVFSAPPHSHDVSRHCIPSSQGIPAKKFGCNSIKLIWLLFISLKRLQVVVILSNCHFCCSNGSNLPKVSSRQDRVVSFISVNVFNPCHVVRQSVVGCIVQVNTTITFVSNAVMESCVVYSNLVESTHWQAFLQFKTYLISQPLEHS